MTAVMVHSNFGAQENKTAFASTFFPSICHKMMGLNAMTLVLNGEF